MIRKFDPLTETGLEAKLALAGAAKCATGCRYYVAHAERMLADEQRDSGVRQSEERAGGDVIGVAKASL